MTIRLAGWVLTSWVFSGLALGGLGVYGLSLAGGSSAAWLASWAAIVVGPALTVRAGMVRARLADDRLDVRNLLRRRRIDTADIERISATITTTPLTRGMPWSQLVAEPRAGRGRPLRIMASCGQQATAVAAFLQALRTASPDVGTEVEPDDFPLRRSRL